MTFTATCDGKDVLNNGDQALLPALQKAFPTASSYEILAKIEQANAVGYKLQISYRNSDRDEDDDDDDDDSSSNNNNSNNYTNKNNDHCPDQVFLKQVIAARYVDSKKDWPDLRRTLLYARTEGRFYGEFAPLLKQKNFHAIPTVYLAEYNLDGWIAENETGMDPPVDYPTVIKENLPHPESRGGTLILECIMSSPLQHYQDSPLTAEQCRQCLAAVAQFHAAAWQDVDLLQKAEYKLSRASFHLSMRNPKELAGIEKAWDHFVGQFQGDMKQAGVWSDSVSKLGCRVKAVAEWLSEQVSVSPTDPFATILHGDYKSMNIFLPVAKEHGSAILCDFASVGLGLGMSDLAMHIHHANTPEFLDTNNGELELVRYYWETLQDSLSKIDEAAGGSSLTGRLAYTWEVALKHYQFAVVDYFRFFLGRFWKSSTHASMEKLQDNKNTNLINRSVPAAVAFVARVDRYLTVVEAEYRKQQAGNRS